MKLGFKYNPNINDNCDVAKQTTVQTSNDIAFELHPGASKKLELVNKKTRCENFIFSYDPNQFAVSPVSEKSYLSFTIIMDANGLLSFSNDQVKATAQNNSTTFNMCTPPPPDGKSKVSTACWSIRGQQSNNLQIAICTNPTPGKKNTSTVCFADAK